MNIKVTGNMSEVSISKRCAGYDGPFYHDSLGHEAYCVGDDEDVTISASGTVLLTSNNAPSREL